MNLQPANLGRFRRAHRFNSQPHVRPGRLLPCSPGPQQQPQRFAGLGRKLQTAKVLALDPVQPHQPRRHAGTPQHLRKCPNLVGLIFRTHHDQLFRFDSHPHGRRGIKRLRPIEHHNPPALAASLTSDEQRQAPGPAAFPGRQPFDQAPSAKPAVRQEPVQFPAPARRHDRLRFPPPVLQLRNLAAQILHKFG